MERERQEAMMRAEGEMLARMEPKKLKACLSTLNPDDRARARALYLETQPPALQQDYLEGLEPKGRAEAQAALLHRMEAERLKAVHERQAFEERVEQQQQGECKHGSRHREAAGMYEDGYGPRGSHDGRLVMHDRAPQTLDARMEQRGDFDPRSFGEDAAV
jgi:hypothetical protein